MATIREITTTWNTINGGGKKTVMYFLAAIPVEDQRIAIAALWSAIGPALATSTGWVVDPEGVEISDADGSLVDSWNDELVLAAAGAGAGEEVADATQALLQWSTGEVVDRRFLKGRTFIPGLTVGTQRDGNLDGPTAAAFLTAARAFIASEAGMVIWHRPKRAGTPPAIVRPGSSDVVDTVKVWSEFAVLRKRRG